MKDAYNYPKTLRSYNQLSSSKSNKNLKHLQQQTHNIDQYCMLSNSKQLVKKVKYKKQSKATDLHKAISKKLYKTKSTYQIVTVQNYDHCKSLQKLQLISNDRGQQIKKIYQQKGRLIAQNQQLKAKLANPTYRQTNLIGKISKCEYQIQQLKQLLTRKDQQIKIQRQHHKQAIQQISKLHKQEIFRLKEQYSQIYQIRKENNYTKIIRQPTQDKQSKNLIPKYIPLQNRLQNRGLNQNITSYIGQDGYERRVINSRNIQSKNQELVKFNNQKIKNDLNYLKKTQNGGTYNSGQKNYVKTYIQKPYTSEKQHDLNLLQNYSSSLTYQCFNQKKS